MSGVDIVVLGVLLLAYALLSQRLAQAWVTAVVRSLPPRPAGRAG